VKAGKPEIFEVEIVLPSGQALIVAEGCPGDGQPPLWPPALAASTWAVKAPRSPGVRWHRSAIVSGAPFSATMSRLPSGERHTCDKASSFSDSGYSRTSSQSACRCSVSARYVVPRSLNADRHRPECLDDRGPPRQDVVAGHAPRAEGQEHRKHDGELLRQHRHGCRDPGEQALKPVAARQAVDDHDRRSGSQAEQARWSR
jgi:hypothetical protein